MALMPHTNFLAFLKPQIDDALKQVCTGTSHVTTCKRLLNTKKCANSQLILHATLDLLRSFLARQ